ncbi:class I SAM-dependent methyltransferase [Verrucomicrobiota bacterium sgz303538]
MHREEIKAIFDQQAASYDKQWAKTAPIRDGLNLLIGAVFSVLRGDARILCIGAGTGAEIIYLAQKFPQWTFTAVEPSAPMLEVCRRRAEEHGIAHRCLFHEGYLDSLPDSEAFDAATCLLVSQFILDRAARSDFFRAIAQRLRPGGVLASADLASDVNSTAYQSLLEVWLRMMKAADISPEDVERMRAAYARDVAVLPTEDVSAIIVSGGFEMPIQFFQAGLIHAWYSKRTSNVGEQWGASNTRR